MILALSAASCAAVGFILHPQNRTFSMLCIGYLVLLNIVTFALYGMDKYYAVSGKWRISENDLRMMALVGGSAGAVAAMFVFRHKISKPEFRDKVFAIAGVQALCVFCIIFFAGCKTSEALAAADKENQARRTIRREAVKLPPSDDAGEYNPWVLIISYDPQIGKTYLLQAVKDYGAEVVYDYNFINAVAIRLPDKNKNAEADAYFRTVKGVTNVSKDHIYHTCTDAVPSSGNGVRTGVQTVPGKVSE